MLDLHPATIDQRQALRGLLVERRARLHLAEPGQVDSGARAAAEQEIDAALDGLDTSPHDILAVFTDTGSPSVAGHVWLCTGAGNYPEEGLAVIRDLRVAAPHPLSAAIDLVLGDLAGRGVQLAVTRLRADDGDALSSYEASGFQRISMVMHRDLDSETGQVVTPSREIRVREMTEAETEAYWARFVDDYTHILIGELRAPGYARREAQWLADQSREGGESVSAIVDASTGKTAGALWFAVTPTGTGAIVDIRMLEEHRGQGYGSATLQHLVQKGGSMGARSLSLGVAFDNPVALRLYRKFSFSPTTIELRRRLEVG